MELLHHMVVLFLVFLRKLYTLFWRRQYSCLENPMDREARWVTIRGLQESDTTERLNSKLNLGGDIDYNQPYVKILRLRVVPTEIFN